jgi:uncharacterized membrane protein YqiK
MPAMGNYFTLFLYESNVEGKTVSKPLLQVIPCIHKVQKLQLSTMTLAIKTDRVYTNLGVPICVTGIAQVSSILIN